MAQWISYTAYSHALLIPQFRTALDYRRRLTFGIDKLDSILQLHLDDIIGIIGETRFTNVLVTRLIVRFVATQTWWIRCQ